jgi:hypothetical protein
MRFIACIALFTLLIGNSLAQGYTAKMEVNIAKMDTSTTEKSFKEVYQTFESLIPLDDDNWLSYYWSAYAGTIYGLFLEDDESQKKTLNQANRYLEIADSLSPRNSEIYCLKAFCLSGEFVTKGMSAIFSLKKKYYNYLDKAGWYNINNPRYYMLKGSALYASPVLFGGDKKEGKELVKTSLEKFETFNPKSSIHPNWGKKEAEQMWKYILEDEKKEE